MLARYCMYSRLLTDGATSGSTMNEMRSSRSINERLLSLSDALGFVILLTMLMAMAVANI